MPRLFYVGAVLAAATCLPAPLSAQTATPNKARIQHVIVRGTDNAMQVEIQTSGTPVAPETQSLTGPDRIVVDFPGALPAAELSAVNVNRGPLKGVRSGLFFNNPPITRIVLDLTKPQTYRISTSQNAIVVSLAPGTMSSSTTSSGTISPQTAGPEKSVVVPPGPAKADRVVIKPGSTAPVTASVAAATSAKTAALPPPHPAKLQRAALVGSANAASAMPATSIVSAAVPEAPSPRPPAVIADVPANVALEVPLDVPLNVPPKPYVNVTFISGMLRIRAEKATLSQVLFEVQRQTQAEIAIPAGAEQEQVIVDLGPAPARDVLAALLNGSRYNFIFVGTELTLERVILTRRDSANY